MKYYKINGGYYLNGDVYISGSKNASLPIICASLIFRRKIRLYNVPNIEDVNVLLKIIKGFGCYVECENECLEIDSSNITTNIVNNELCTKFRASYYLLGSLVNRFDEVSVRKQGGCDFVNRPIDIHKYVFSLFFFI